MPPKKAKMSLTTSSAGDYSSDKSDVEESLPFSTREETFILKISQSISASFEKCIDKIITNMDSRINKRIDSQEVTSYDIKNRTDQLEKKYQKLADENSELKQQVLQLKSKCDSLELAQDDLDQYSRSKNLLIHGIPQTADEGTGNNLEARVLQDLNNKLGLNLEPMDITALHRNGPSGLRANIGTAASRPAPVLIQFLRRAKKNTLLQNRRNLKGTGVSVSEQLTAKRVKLLFEASDLQKANKLQGAWAHEGKILIKVPDGSTKTVLSQSDLLPYR
jgi:hypothetical protein